MERAAPEDLVYGIRPPSHRLPPTARPGRVRLQVSDAGRSVEFYTQVLGLAELQSGSGTAVLGDADRGTPILEVVGQPGARPAPARGRLGLYHFAVLLPDRPALGRFLAHLRRFGISPGMSDHLVSEALYLSDPDGLGIEVYADRPREQWSVRGAELAMATAPLDVHALLDAAGRETWQGAPAGTTLGHVHLYVADLREAEAFYHAALGLDKVVWSYPGALFLSAGGYHHHLGVNTWAATRTGAQPDEARLLDWELLLPAAHIDPTARHLAGRGFDAEREGDRVRTRDPWGTELVLTPGAPAR